MWDTYSANGKHPRQFLPQTVEMPMTTVIIGAGIAGLTVAEGLVSRGEPVIILERYPNVGGRIATLRNAGIQYEIGAGRIFHAHKRVHALIKRFKLHTYPIGDSVVFRGAQTGREETDAFPTIMGAILRTLEELPASTLGGATIAELLPKEWQPLLKRFPYWAELHMLRGDLAVEAFKPAAEMGTYGGYVGIQEGIDALTAGLRDAVVRRGVDLRVRHRVSDVRRLPGGGGFEIVGDYGKKAEAKPFTLRADRVILATCRCSLSDFSVLRRAPLLKQLQTSPLTRIYAVYPPAPGKRKVWFDGLEKTVSDSVLRFIIPIDAKKGLIMISYTDGPADTGVWKGLKGDALIKAIQREVRALFADRGPIPEPTYMEAHEWSQGCTYWVPGDYSVDAAIEAAMHPAKGVYVVGESVSRHQAWIESALESAEALLRII
jgi:monoamine oxidase